MKKKYDVLLLCQYFYPDSVSSAQLPYDTAIELADNGLKVDVLTGYPKEYNTLDEVKYKEQIKGINIKRLKYLQLKRSSFIGRILNYFSFTASVTLHFYSMKNYRMILVYSNPPVLPLVASLAQKVFKTKIMFASYDVYPEIAYETRALSRGSILGKMMQGINKLVFNKFIHVIALSSEMKTLLLENRKTIKDNQVHVIPNWDTTKAIERELFIDNNSEFKKLKSSKKFILSYFGNLGIAQDVSTVLDVIYKIKDNPNIHFVFAGHGNKVDDLKQYVEKNQIKNISIYGFLTGTDFEEALNISDFAIVSLGENLTGLAVPSKTYTYLRAGTPVFAIMENVTDIVQDLEKYEAGFHIGHGESDKLIEYISSLSNNKEKLNQMKINAENLYRDKYTKKLSAEKYTEVVKTILKEDYNVRK